MPKIPDSFYQELLSRADIESVVSPYVRLKRSGQHLLGLCPFHGERTPSFTVDPQKGLFYCFGCNVGGSSITFLQKIENLDFTEAVKELADRAGLRMPEMNAAEAQMEQLRRQILEANREAARFFHAQLMGEPGRAALNYLLKRGLTMKTIKHFELGFAPNDSGGFMEHMRTAGFGESLLLTANLARNGSYGVMAAFWNRVMFPILDVRGRVIAFGGRVMDNSMPKYINTSDTPVYKKSAGVYALNFAKNSGGKLILAEGYMDVIALHQADFTGAVACLGTATTKDQAMLLRRYAEEVVLSYDADEAGQKAAIRAIGVFDTVGLKVRVLRWDKERDGKDPDEILRRHGRERFQRLLEGAANDVEFRLLSERSKFDIATDDGKRGFLARACEVMASMRLSETTLDIYAGRLAGELSVSREAITRETERRRDILKRQGAKRQRDFIPTNLAPVYNREGTVPVEMRSAEKILLYSLMRAPEFYPALSETLTASLFQSPDAQRGAEVLFRRLANGEETSLIYLEQDADGEVMSLFTGLELTFNKSFTVSLQECRDCIAVLQKTRGKPPDDVAAISADDWLKLFSG
ncbi:MAG: DNA primase [Oscillospiraceae bacterium]|jgi:DNA primase|nr:DNA primase [Oscillospiraceae bacterium]